MTTWWRAYVRVGDHEWTVEKGDPAAYGPLDNLRLGWRLPENAAWPTQPEIPWARFGVVVPTTADFQGVDIGTPVAIALWTHDQAEPLPAGYKDLDGLGTWIPLATFGGRVTELNAAPHDLGVVYDIGCLDYLQDLVDVKVSAATATGWPSQYLRDRIKTLVELAPAAFGGTEPWTGGDFGGPSASYGSFWGRGPASGTDLPELKPVYDHMVDHLAQFAEWWFISPPIQGGSRYVLTANNTAGLFDVDQLVPDPTKRFMLWGRYKRVVARDDPDAARFRPTGVGGKWRPHVDPEDTVAFVDPIYNPTGTDLPAERFGILTADHVDFDADWSRTRKARQEQVWVESTLDFLDRARMVEKAALNRADWSNPDDPNPPTLVIQTELGYGVEAQGLAQFLLADPSRAYRWEVDKFRVYSDLPGVADRITRGNATSWFHLASAIAGPVTKVIAGVPVDQNPNPGESDAYAGVLTSAELTIKDGRHYIDFTLSRDLPRQGTAPTLENAPALSLASMQADPTQDALTLLDLDPGYNLIDYRLTRKG